MNIGLSRIEHGVAAKKGKTGGLLAVSELGTIIGIGLRTVYYTSMAWIVYTHT